MIYPAQNYPLNCGSAGSTFSRVFSKRSGLGGYKLESIPYNRILSSSNSSIITVQDRTIQRNISSSYVTDYEIRVVPLLDGWFRNVSLTSLSPNILSKTNDNSFLYENNGICLIQGVSDDGETVLTKVITSSGSPVTVDIFQSWVAGSLSDHCFSTINSLIESKTQKNVFSVANGTTFVRNSNCWTSNIDLSCASPWNSTDGSLRAGTLVSPRHVIFCKHYSFHPSVGATIWFVSQNNVIVTKTITHLNPISSDIVVGTLDSDVPSFIKFAKILPSNYNNYLPSLGTSLYYIPSLYLNQTDTAGIMMVLGLGEGITGQGVFSSNESSFYKPDMSIYNNFYIPVVAGDSGNPMFLIINGELVLLGVFTGAFAGSHIAGPNNKSQINQIMSATGYQLTEIDLSSFNMY